MTPHFPKMKSGMLICMLIAISSPWYLKDIHHVSQKKMKKKFVNVLHRLVPRSLRSHYSSNTQRNFLVYLEGTFMSMNIPPLFKGYEAYSLRGHRSYTNLTPPYVSVRFLNLVCLLCLKFRWSLTRFYGPLNKGGKRNLSKFKEFIG